MENKYKSDIDVSIIIVNYNTKQMTCECLDSIFKTTKDVTFEVILVDNASKDGSVECFKKDKRIKFLGSNENLGFGRANNLGYNYSKGKYILFLNSDTIVLNNAVKCFYDEMSAFDENVSCIGTLLKDMNMNVPLGSYAKFPTISSILKELLLVYIPKRYRGNMKFQNRDLCFPLQVDYVIGADLFVRRGTIEQLGLFDPDFFMYYEEAEMQHRYYKNGYKSMIVDSPSIIHLGGGI